jgi:hypothetical protein
MHLKTKPAGFETGFQVLSVNSKRGAAHGHCAARGWQNTGYKITTNSDEDNIRGCQKSANFAVLARFVPQDTCFYSFKVVSATVWVRAPLFCSISPLHC